VVEPEYREEPVNGSPDDGVDGAEGVGDWAATYLDAPVKGSAYCEGAFPGAEPAELRYLVAPNNMYFIMDVKWTGIFVYAYQCTDLHILLHLSRY
jgi:hypothetical protein